MKKHFGSGAYYLLGHKKTNGRVPLISVGGIQTYQDVERILAEDIPLFSVGKSILLDPDWPIKISEGREYGIITRIDMKCKKS